MHRRRLTTAVLFCAALALIAAGLWPTHGGESRCPAAPSSVILTRLDHNMICWRFGVVQLAALALGTVMVAIAGFRLFRYAGGQEPLRTASQAAALDAAVFASGGLILTAVVVASGSFNAGNQFCPAVVRSLVNGYPVAHTPCFGGAVARSLLAAFLLVAGVAACSALVLSSTGVLRESRMLLLRSAVVRRATAVAAVVIVVTAVVLATTA